MQMGKSKRVCKRAPLSACVRSSGVPAESGAQRAIRWGGGLAEEGAVAEPRRLTRTQPACVMSGAQRAPLGLSHLGPRGTLGDQLDQVGDRVDDTGRPVG